MQRSPAAKNGQNGPSQDNLMAFVHRYNDLMTVRDSTDKLIEDVLLYCQGLERALQQETDRLSGELRNCQLDLADATTNRRDVQQKLSKQEAELDMIYKENDQLKNRNSYTLALIDGDGLIFQDHWIRQGLEGGRKAASALRAAISHQLNDLDDDQYDVQIVAKVFANFSGVSKNISQSDFRDFAIGFTQASPAFDFVDVGSSKERVDYKIRENAKWHLENYNCRHVFFGVSHDAGYAPFLEELLRDGETSQRITVIEGVAMPPELRATGVNVTRLSKDLFRGDRLVERSSAYAASAAIARAASPAGSVSSSGANSSTISYANAITNGTPPPVMSLPLAPGRPSPRSKSSASTPSATTPGGGAGGAQYQTIPPQQPDWNPGTRGLDEPITVNVAVMEAVKKRKDTDKLCNNHFLRGPCAKGDACNFVHDYKPNGEEIHAIAVLARQNPCTHGQDCENWECIYGHHCPSIREGVCSHPYCKFDEDQHPPGTKYTSNKTGHSRS